MAATTRNKNRSVRARVVTSESASTSAKSTGGNHTSETGSSSGRCATAIEICIDNELRRYYEMLDGEEPAQLYRMVIRQAESALIRSVMAECGGNQTKASDWLGISRGNLRSKLAAMDNTGK